VTVAGAIEAVSEYDVEVILVGDKDRLNEVLKEKRYPAKQDYYFSRLGSGRDG